MHMQMHNNGGDAYGSDGDAAGDKEIIPMMRTIW
jgi:hypothetical protein